MMNFKPYKIKLFLILFLVVSLVSCGYKFSGGGKLPSGTGVICISLFTNRSSEVMLENTIVNDLVYEFTRNGQKIAKDEGSADSIMTGEIQSVTSETVTRTTNLTSVESRVTVVLLAQLKNQKGSILWEKNNITDSEVYTVDSDNTVDSSARREILKKISKRVATKIYSGMTEDF